MTCKLQAAIKTFQMSAETSQILPQKLPLLSIFIQTCFLETSDTQIHFPSSSTPVFCFDHFSSDLIIRVVQMFSTVIMWRVWLTFQWMFLLYHFQLPCSKPEVLRLRNHSWALTCLHTLSSSTFRCMTENVYSYCSGKTNTSSFWISGVHSHYFNPSIL